MICIKENVIPGEELLRYNDTLIITFSVNFHITKLKTVFLILI